MRKLAPFLFIAVTGCAIPGDFPTDARKGLALAAVALDIWECAASPGCTLE